MSTIFTVAYYTFKELLKSRVLMNAFFMGCFLIALTYIASEFTFGVPQRIAIDFGLGILTLSSVGMALFFGVELLSKEIETRTIYMIISRPVERYKVLLGKYLGFLSILFLNLIILASMSLITFKVLKGDITNMILWNIIYIFIEALLVLLLVVLFSLNTNNTVSVISVIVLYVTGHAMDPNTLKFFVEGRPAFEKLINFYHFVLPGFYKLNIKDFVLYQENLSSEYLISTLGYGFLYSLFLITLTAVIFERKDLN
ncbi:MAG: ABC transporter permease subunit [Bacteriovoracaceae bacterium]|nr:ABC transporter permease subunit [Bacteriovoracaceae bacterium]